MVWTVKQEGDTYETAREDFSWDIPTEYNIARDCLRKHDKDSIALHQGYPDGRRNTYTFAEIDEQSDQLAVGLEKLGVGQKDRVAVLLPQTPEALLTHMACWKLGAISVPLSKLFGTGGLAYRLTHSGACVLVTDDEGAETYATIDNECPSLDEVIYTNSSEQGLLSIEDMLAQNNDEFGIAETTRETPAMLIYTSGTTGSPKGVLHRHELIPGHCATSYMYLERDTVQSTVGWTPASWAWVGGLLNLVLTMWHYGRPVVGYPMGSFDVETAFEIMAEFDVTHAGLPPTALRMLKTISDPTEQYDLSLDVVHSGGEAVTSDIHQWANDIGIVVNELYGQTEAASLISNCHGWFDPRPGWMGKPVPGHDVTVLDPETGKEKPPGAVGEIAVRVTGDPTVFEEYWQDPEATAEATVDGWLLTGDLGEYDQNNFFKFHGRSDDIIVTSGHRVGPDEVEEAILQHKDIAEVGVIGVPDETRGEIIKAFVQPVAGVDTSERFADDIQNLVRSSLAAYKYPREVEFVGELPTTGTGKIRRSALREIEE